MERTKKISRTEAVKGATRWANEAVKDMLQAVRLVEGVEQYAAVVCEKRQSGDQILDAREVLEAADYTFLVAKSAVARMTRLEGTILKQVKRSWDRIELVEDNKNVELVVEVPGMQRGWLASQVGVDELQ